MTQLSYIPEAPRFSRRWWMTSLRTLFWVVLVTVLIWIYADMEFTDNVEISGKIHLQPARADEIKLLSAETVNVTFTVRGNRGSIDRYRRLLAEQNATIEYTIPDTYGPGPHLIRTAEQILAVNPEISRAGLSVLTASPAGLEVELDRMQLQKLPVVFDHSGAKFASPPVLRPETVNVLVAESKWRQILRATPSGEPALKTTRLDLKGIPTGERITRTLEIVPSIASVPVQPQTTTVEVTFQIEQATGTRTIPVTVQLLAPAAWATDQTWTDYELKRKDDLEWRKQITLAGPKEELQKLRPEDVQAYVPLTEDDKKPVASWLTREVVVRWPEGLNLRLVGDRPSVSFKLVKRVLAPAPP